MISYNYVQKTEKKRKNLLRNNYTAKCKYKTTKHTIPYPLGVK